MTASRAVSCSIDGTDAPPLPSLERRGVSLHEAPAQLLEKLQVRERHRLRIDRRERIGPVQRADQHRRKVRL